MVYTTQPECIDSQLFSGMMMDKRYMVNFQWNNINNEDSQFFPNYYTQLILIPQGKNLGLKRSIVKRHPLLIDKEERQRLD